MSSMRHYLFLLLAGIIVTSGCVKEKTNVIPQPSASYGDVNLKIGYDIDGAPLIFDSLLYTNVAGNKYSISKINYYISRIRFYANEELKYSSDDIFYLDAKTSSFSQIKLKNIPAIEYDSISFNIGLDEEQNISYSLPANNENIIMEWPDMMGGGYHFLKLEGHWLDSNGIVGYAMHIGKNGFCVRSGAKSKFKIPAGDLLGLTMSMNVNEWFRNPNVYDLASDGVYSMGNAALMKKLSENGKNVFSIEP